METSEILLVFRGWCRSLHTRALHTRKRGIGGLRRHPARSTLARGVPAERIGYGSRRRGCGLGSGRRGSLTQVKGRRTQTRSLGIDRRHRTQAGCLILSCIRGIFALDSTPRSRSIISGANRRAVSPETAHGITVTQLHLGDRAPHEGLNVLKLTA